MSAPRRRGRRQSEEAKREIEAIRNYLETRGVDVSVRLKPNFRTQMMKDLGIKDKNRILYLLSSIRQTDKVIGTLGTNSEILQNSDKIQEYLLSENLHRGSQREGAACEIIVEILNNQSEDIELKRWGVGLFIGTPTALCASRNPNNNQIITDNLEVAMALKWATKDPITIVIGNAMDARKADRKAAQWKKISSIPARTPVIRRVVDKHTFEYYVERLAKAHKKRLVKVVLLTSGNWTGNKKALAKGLDLNYQEVAQRLTLMYSNLHILAMTREHPGYGFDVRYLHAGEEVVYWAKREISNLDERCNYTMEVRRYD